MCFRFLNAQPLPIKLGLLRQKKNKRQKRDEDAPVDNQNAVESPSEGDIADSPGLAGDLNPVAPSDPINCNWNIQVKSEDDKKKLNLAEQLFFRHADRARAVPPGDVPQP